MPDSDANVKRNWKQKVLGVKTDGTQKRQGRAANVGGARALYNNLGRRSVVSGSCPQSAQASLSCRPFCSVFDFFFFFTYGG
jgi:hypothetical protein